VKVTMKNCLQQVPRQIVLCQFSSSSLKPWSLVTFAKAVVGVQSPCLAVSPKHAELAQSRASPPTEGAGDVELKRRQLSSELNWLSEKQ